MGPRSAAGRAGGGGVSRRDALRRLAMGGAAAGMAAPGSLHGAGPMASPPPAAWPGGWNREALPLPDAGLRERDPESYWGRVRDEQFLLPPGRAFLNPGSLGVMPWPVLRAVVGSLAAGAEYGTDTVPRWGYETLDREREEMASFLGCGADELAFTHNCTESMSFIAAGMELKAGDEVLTTNQEHGSGISCWRVRAARTGIVVREVELPVTPREPGELLGCLTSAMGPRTRVLSFSGITSPTGLVLPTRQLCETARARGVRTVVDGAHMDGQVPVNLRELGCDYFAGSPHKWMFAPPGCGLLYGRADALDRLWPTVATGGWDNRAGLRSARFMMVGTNNRSTIDGMLAGLRFLRALGEETVYARQHALARHVVGEARRRPYLELVTPDDPSLYRAMVSVRFKTDKLEPLWAGLRRENIGVLGGQRLRISVHVHTRRADLDRFFGVCDRVLGA